MRQRRLIELEVLLALALGRPSPGTVVEQKAVRPAPFEGLLVAQSK